MFPESNLKTHDLALPCPHMPQQIQNCTFQFLLLSTADLDPSKSTMQRIERLYHQRGGQQVGIIFLLKGNSSPMNGTVAFMELQARLLSGLEIPIIPLSAVSSLETTVLALERSINSEQPEKSQVLLRSSVTLLPFCCLQPPMPEHARNILSDLLDDIPALARATTTADGREELARWLNGAWEGLVDDIAHFWEREYIFDE
ncbi:hypothetical protein F5884DRAFT_169324 [Xylogone sp. PMI_703]|nr:hypothetical protein F5884DRAFT_169324 [Xylogone sp. PMI_703]